MTTRLALSSIAFSISLLACGDPDPVDHDETPDATMPAAFDLSVGNPKLPTLTGTSGTLDVAIARHASFTGDVAISIANLPDGVTAPPVTIAADATTATLTLVAAGDAPHSLPTEIDVVGTAGSDRGTTTATVTVYGPPGSVDTSFRGGKLILPVGDSDDYAYATAIQADGKVLLAGRAAEGGGRFAIVRLTRDGELDSTFGGSGKVITEIGSGATIHGLAVQADGKIVAVGTTNLQTGTQNDFAVARYLPDGTLDATFSGDGKTVISLGADADTAYAVAIQPDGKIVVGGDSNRSVTGLDFALVRLNADGSLDSTFGDGHVTTALAASSARDSIYALALQTIDGETRIVAVGGEGDFAAARYHANGTLDTTFNGTGKLIDVYDKDIGAARAVAVTPQNELVVAGHISHHFAVVKLSQAGQLDPVFGKRTTNVTASSWDEGQALALDGDKILVAGWAYEGVSSSGNFAIVRYASNGEIDQTFAGGIVITPVASSSKPDQATSMALQVDERVPTVRAVVGGFASTSNSDFAVARYWR